MRALTLDISCKFDAGDATMRIRQLCERHLCSETDCLLRATVAGRIVKASITAASAFGDQVPCSSILGRNQASRPASGRNEQMV